MKTIEYEEYGSYDVLKIHERPEPVLLDGQLMVKVTVTAVNQLDNTIRSGFISNNNSQKPYKILGNEGAGYIVKGNEEFPNGTRVIISCFNHNGQIRGLYVDGIWQEYLAVYPGEIISIPDHITDEEAAAFPVGFFSAQACLDKAGFTSGKNVLSLAIGGSVGNAGFQLARAQGANIVISTTSTTEKALKASEAGFQNIIDLSKESLTDGVARITEGKGVDIVIDSLGGPLTGEALHSLSRNGVLVSIGYSAGVKFTANITDFVWKGIQMRGQSLNGWFNQEEQNAVWNKIMPLLENGKVKPILSASYPASNIAEAQEFLIEKRPFGKVLIKF